MRRFVCLLGCICACWANDNKRVELRNCVELLGKKYVIKEYCEEIDKIKTAIDQNRLTRERAIKFAHWLLGKENVLVNCVRSEYMRNTSMGCVLGDRCEDRIKEWNITGKDLKEQLQSMKKKIAYAINFLILLAKPKKYKNEELEFTINGIQYKFDSLYKTQAMYALLDCINTSLPICDALVEEIEHEVNRKQRTEHRVAKSHVGNAEYNFHETIRELTKIACNSVECIHSDDWSKLNTVAISHQGKDSRVVFIDDYIDFIICPPILNEIQDVSKLSGDKINEKINEFYEYISDDNVEVWCDNKESKQALLDDLIKLVENAEVVQKLTLFRDDKCYTWNSKYSMPCLSRLQFCLTRGINIAQLKGEILSAVNKWPQDIEIFENSTRISKDEFIDVLMKLCD